MLVFEDGWLVFQGRRCSFSLGSGDVVFTKIEKGEMSFQFAALGENHEVRFQTQASLDFKTAAETWKREASKLSGEVFPPLVPNENAQSALKAIAMASLTSCLFFGVYEWIVQSLSAWVTASLLVVFALGLVLYFRRATEQLARVAQGLPSLPPLWKLSPSRRRLSRSTRTE